MGNSGRNLFDKLYVCPYSHRKFILCNGRKFGILKEVFLHCKIVLLFVFIPLQYIGRGINNHHTRNAIDNDYVVGADFRGYTFQANNGRNLYRFCNDGCMGCLAAHVDSEAQNLFLRHLSRIGGRKVFGNNYYLFVNI